MFLGYVHQYNSLTSQPDVLKSLYSPLQSSSSLEGLRLDKDDLKVIDALYERIERVTLISIWWNRYHDGRLSDQQMALLQYQRENIHFLCEEVNVYAYLILSLNC